MTLRDLGWLTDENIHPQVVAFLREEGISVTDVKEEDWYGTTDRVLLQQAYQHQLIIATQDSDFGTLIFRESEPFWGIVYLRPGHLLPLQSIQMVADLLTLSPEIEPPFIIIAEWHHMETRFRVRQM